MWGKNEGAGVPRCAGRNPPRASACRRAPPAAWTSRSAGGRRRNDRENEPPYLRSTPRYNGSRAFGCRRGPSLDGHRVRLPKGAAMIRPVRHRFASKARARAERPPLWGSDDVSAMRNYRYRHRDSPYVAMRSGGTNIPGRTTVGGRRRTSRSAVARKACVRDAVGRARGSGGTNARVSVFSSTSILGCGAQGAGGAERRTDQFSVRLF